MSYPICTYFQAVIPFYPDILIIDQTPDGSEYNVIVIDLHEGGLRLSKEWLAYRLQNGDIAIPEGRYEIWEEDGCTCGAQHTSVPSLHLAYCNIGGK